MESRRKGEMIDALARIHQYRITNNDGSSGIMWGDPLFRENPYFVLIETAVLRVDIECRI